MFFAEDAVDGHEAGERGQCRAAEQRVALGDGGVAAQGHDDGRVRRDDALADALRSLEREELSLGELPGVVEVEIFRHGPLPERGGERSLFRVIVTLRRGSLGALGSFTIAVHARAADGAGEPLDVHEVPQPNLAEDEQKPGEKRGVDV